MHPSLKVIHERPKRCRREVSSVSSISIYIYNIHIYHIYIKLQFFDGIYMIYRDQTISNHLSASVYVEGTATNRPPKNKTRLRWPWRPNPSPAVPPRFYGLFQLSPIFLGFAQPDHQHIEVFYLLMQHVGQDVGSKETPRDSYDLSPNVQNISKYGKNPPNDPYQTKTICVFAQTWFYIKTPLNHDFSQDFPSQLNHVSGDVGVCRRPRSNWATRTYRWSACKPATWFLPAWPMGKSAGKHSIWCKKTW